MNNQKAAGTTIEAPPLPPRLPSLHHQSQSSSGPSTSQGKCYLDTVIPPPSASLIQDKNVFERSGLLSKDQIPSTRLQRNQPPRGSFKLNPTMSLSASFNGTSSSSRVTTAVSASFSNDNRLNHRPLHQSRPLTFTNPTTVPLSLSSNYNYNQIPRGFSNNAYSPYGTMMTSIAGSIHQTNGNCSITSSSTFSSSSNCSSVLPPSYNQALAHRNSVDNFTYLLHTSTQQCQHQQQQQQIMSRTNAPNGRPQNLLITSNTTMASSSLSLPSIKPLLQSQNSSSDDLIDLGNWEEKLCRQISNGNFSDDILMLFDPLLDKEKEIKRMEDEKRRLELLEEKKRLELQEEKMKRASEEMARTNGTSNVVQRIDDDLEKKPSPGESQKCHTSDHKKTVVFRVQYRECRSNSEIRAFTDKLRALRAEYKFNDSLTNPGFVVSPTLDSQRDNSLSVKLIIETTLAAGAPVIFTCNVNTSISHVIEHTIYSLVDDETSSLDSDNFILKVNSLEEYLLPSSTLGDYVYVHHCHKFDKDVRLKLVPKTEEIKQRFGRTSKDDENLSSLCPDDLLPATFVCRFGEANYDSVNILLDTLSIELNKLLSSTSQEKYQVHLNGVLQVTKAVCSLLGNCETYQLTEAFENLSQHVTQYKLNICESSLSDAFKSVHNEVISNAATKFIECLQRMMSCYCEAFPVDFQVDDNQSNGNKEFEDIEKFNDSLLCYVGVMCALNFEWENRYKEFYLLCEVRYGDRLLAECRSQRVVVTQGLFKRLVFNEPLNFEMVPISSLPREASLFFTLYGIEHVQHDSSPTSSTPPSSSSSEYSGDTVLGITIFQLFDLEDCLKQGTFVVGLWTDEAVTRSQKMSIPHSCIGKGCPLLVLDIPGTEKIAKFPKIEPDSRIWTRRELKSLDSATQTEIYQILNRDPIGEMQVDDKRLLWDRRYYLMDVPHALPKVLKAIINWNSTSLSKTYAMISNWTPLSAIDAMQLFLPSFPDRFVRSMAVNWLKSLTNDEVIDYLPQLIQALRYDLVLDSPLVWFLFRRCFSSVRVTHQLYWLVKENIENPVFAYRSRIILNALLRTCGTAVKTMFEDQETMLEKLSYVSERLKAARDGQRLQVVLEELESVHDLLILKPMPLPISPSMIVTGLDVKSCSYFTSNTLPLRLVFKNYETKSLLSSVEAIYKVGDDLRQDMLTMQMIQIMDKLWLKDGLDLKIVTFSCVATDTRKGFVEMVKSAETLRKIQTEHGVTGSFKDRCIANWLQKHNTYELEYQQAVDNFTYSCAGYAVATYILGVCDRHNDNIMITTSGHLFHIDFGKFLGDAQMLGNIKRDRVPFVLTSDMAYVINGGDKPTRQFQFFIDSCCQAFNIIRRHTNLFLSLFSLMISSGIPGVSLEAVKYVHKALHPSLSEAEAMSEFTRMIEESLKSRFTQFNFFIHNLAQLRFTGDHNDQQLLSFAPKVFTRETDCKILHLEVVYFCKKYEPEKQYFFIVKVEREHEPDPSYVLRTYREFIEFYQKLAQRFPLAKFHSLGRGASLIGRSNTRDAAEKRMQEIRLFLNRLLCLADEISQSDLVYTFFHHLLRDQEWLRDNKLPSPISSLSGGPSWTRDVSSVRRDSIQGIASGQIKLSILYKHASLTVMIMHARNLQSPRSNAPDCYAKTYLLPDPHKYTKRKTKVVWKNANPSFMEMIVYQMPLEVIKQRTLQVSIWDYDRVQENLFLGAALIPLSEMHLLSEIVSWYPLEI